MLGILKILYLGVINEFRNFGVLINNPVIVNNKAMDFIVIGKGLVYKGKIKSQFIMQPVRIEAIAIINIGVV